MGFRTQTEQQRFTQGELDPMAVARGDIDQYYGAAALARNFFALRQGGLASRPGLEYVYSLPVAKHKFTEFRVDEGVKYLIVFTVGQIDIFRDKELKQTLATDLLTENIINTLSTAQAYDAMFLFAPSMPVQRLFRIADDNWTLSPQEFTYIPAYAFTPVTATPAGTLTPSAKEGNITLNASTAVFSAASVGQYVDGNGGRARITVYNSATNVTAITEIAFFDESAIASGQWRYLTGFEDAWSDTRGWPAHGVFYEGRLWLAGSNSLSSSLWGSTVNDFFSFDPGRILDDEAISVTLDNPDPITGILAGRSLQVFTLGGEYVALQPLGEPITPASANFKQQSSIGSKPYLNVFDIEGATIFCNYNSLHEFVYDDSQNAYTSGIISLMFGHLVRSPLDFTARRSYSDQGATYLILVNNNFELTIINILRAQNVLAATRQATSGKFLNCGTDGNDIYVIVEHVIDGRTVHYLEAFNDKHVLDCSKIIELADPENRTVAGFGHLAGETLKVVADGVLLPDVTVAADGTIKIERDRQTYSLEAGYNFVSEMIDLPMQTPNQGSTLGMKKRVAEVVLLLSETNICAVNGQKMHFRGFGPADNGSPLDKPAESFTGIKKLYGFKGWDYTAQIKITKDLPGSLAVLSLSKKVTVNT